MQFRSSVAPVAFMAACLLAAPAAATRLFDPAGDFLGTYTGPQVGDVDLLSATARRDAGGVSLSLTVDGAIGTSPGAIYVWGINRGAGTPRLTFGSPSVGAGILFDAVFVMFPNGDARLVTFPAAGAPSITNLPGALAIDGAGASGFAPFALLPSRGFDVADYTYALWARKRADPAVDGTNVELADFLPDAASFTASVPEPATWGLMLAGFGAVGMAARRRRIATVSG